MNSTCSMKAWHRCVSLWGPPGRLCTASSVVETGFKICFPPHHHYHHHHIYFYNWLAGCIYVWTIWAPNPVDKIFTCGDLKANGSTHGRDIGPNSAARWYMRVQCRAQPSATKNWLEVVKPRQGENPFKWSRCGRRAEALSFPSSVAALASLVTQLITLVLRRFIALHSNCTNAPDSQTAFMAALLRQQGGCPVIRDGIPARTKGCARQGQAMAKRSNHKLQPLSLRLWPFWLSYMNANALWLAPIKTVITTANMASQAKKRLLERALPKPISAMAPTADRYHRRVMESSLCTLERVSFGSNNCFG